MFWLYLERICNAIGTGLGRVWNGCQPSQTRPKPVGNPLQTSLRPQQCLTKSSLMYEQYINSVPAVQIKQA
jgi:hypothetical protein